MDAGTLARAMGDSLSITRYAQLLPAYEKAMRWANINTVNRAAMFAAQLGHESVGLRYQNEIADGSAYEWRSDLGNTQPGDGRRFKGHGWIQITGRHNHTQVSRWAHSKGIVPTPTYFVDRPEELGNDTFCWVGPAWYWVVARPNLNAMSDARDLVGVTRAINGGTNGLDDRRRRYNQCLALGEALLPGETMSYADDELKKKFPSRSKYRLNDDPIDTLAGMILNVDARIHEEFVEREARKGVQWAVDLVKREAAKGDAGAKSVADSLGGK